MSVQRETLTHTTAPAVASGDSYVDWPAILAGAVVASAIAFVFTTFGAAIGLTLASPYEGEGSALAALIAVGGWMLWTTISSFMAGGYIAGRMRRRIDAASSDEIAVRDGIHGLAVWGAAIFLGVFIFGTSVDTAVQATTETATAAATVVDQPAGDAAASGADDTAVAANMTEAEAKAAADAARQFSVISAFVVAASLMIAGAGAYWSAGIGGQHRDEGRAFERFGRWA